MDNPLFGGCWGRVPERRYTRPNYCYSNPYAATPVKSESAPKVKPKNVVTIPVNFVDSEKPRAKKVPTMDENTAALKIQAAFRGFCVRKHRPLNKLRVIIKTKAEAEEIRKRVNDEHVVELFRRDDKERLKITEGIMSLLLRLDEIQGVIPFVRESRKAVIRYLVSLQETVDEIISVKCRQDAATAVEERHTVEGNDTSECLLESPNEDIKGKCVSDKAEESLPSQMRDLQIEGSPEGNNHNNTGVEDFEQGSSEDGQVVSGAKEWTMVDDVKDEENLKRNRDENMLSEDDAPPTVLSMEECDAVKALDDEIQREGGTGKTHDDENSSEFRELAEAYGSPEIPCIEESIAVNSREIDDNSESLDSLKVQTIHSDAKPEIVDLMECEEAGDKSAEKVTFIEDIGKVREENEKLKRTVSDLLKKSEKQSEMIHDMSLRISQLEEQVSQCNKKKKVGDGKKKSGTSTEERGAQTNSRRRKSDRHSSNCLEEDWF